MAVSSRTLAVLVLWATLAPAQQPTFRSTTRIVEVTFKAARSNGSAVNDLTVEDLKLTDNGRVQEIRTLERMQGVGQDNAARPKPRRLTILLLDALNTDWSDQIYARRAASQALEQIPPGERVAVFALGRDLRLLHDFSSDYASLRALIQRFRGEVPDAGVSAPVSPFSAEFSYSDMVSRPGPRGGEWAAMRQRQNILDTFAALKAIAKLVQRAPGQKNLLWLSSGFPLRIRSAGGPTSFDSFHNDAEAAMRELNAANVTLYPIDARGLSVSPLAYINIGTMQEVAELTGGKAYYNGNDLGSMVRSAIEDSREAYVLTYAPSEYAEDGKYHQLRLATMRRGVRLRHRPGYTADKPAQK